MKESLVGLTTIAILFGLVWLSQGDIYTTKTKSERYTNHQNENVEDNYSKSTTDEQPDKLQQPANKHIHNHH